MPIKEEIQRKARILRTKINNKRRDNKATEDEEDFAETAQVIYDEYRYQVQKADEAEGKLKGFRKELLETGQQREAREMDRAEKLYNLTIELDKVKKEHADKLKVMQPVSATAELQVEVQTLNETLIAAREMRDKTPHDRYCPAVRMNLPDKCNCWKSKLTEIIG